MGGLCPRHRIGKLICEVTICKLEMSVGGLACKESIPTIGITPPTRVQIMAHRRIVPSFPRSWNKIRCQTTTPWRENHQLAKQQNGAQVAKTRMDTDKWDLVPLRIQKRLSTLEYLLLISKVRFSRTLTIKYPYKKGCPQDSREQKWR